MKIQMQEQPFIEPDFKIDWIKTLGELLQDIVENDDDKRYSLHEFLLESTEEDRKRIESKLAEADCKQFYEYMDGFTFVSEEEIHMACENYYEATMNRAISMGECVDLYEVVDQYMQERNLTFDEE